MKTIKEIQGNYNLQVISEGCDGGFGIIYKRGKQWATVIWSDGGGWEHVSVSPMKTSVVPTWDEMCKIKSMFFYDEETVVQYHPKKSEYVNNRPNCLHLWRPLNVEMPTPPSIMVGVKDGQTAQEVAAAIAEVI